MTYVIGGTPRSGKTVVKNLILERYKIPGFCTDYLRDAFGDEVPEFGIKYRMSDEEKSEILWPYFKGILNQRAKNYGDDLLIEGTNFLPKHMEEFQGDGRTRICFLGYAEISPEEKFKSIRDNPSKEGEWTNDMSDQKLMTLVTEFIDISKYFKSECAKCGFRYFDTSRNFDEVIEQAVSYLIGRNGQNRVE